MIYILVATVTFLISPSTVDTFDLRIFNCVASVSFTNK